MAQIGEDTGIPEVAPDVDGIRVQASAEDFGAGIGTGLQQLGAGIEKTTDFYGQVAADDANNNWEKKAQSILYGDPNDPDKPGYFALKGSDAMRERPNVIKALQAAEDEQSNTLFTAQSKFQFRQAARHTRTFYNQQVGSHYDQQYNAWGINTNTDQMALARDAAARDPDNLQALGIALQKSRQAAVQLEQFKNGKQADATAAILQSDQAIQLARLDTLMVQDPEKAWKYLTDGSSGMDVLKSLPGKQYASLYRSVQDNYINASTAARGHKNLTGWIDKAQEAVNPGPGVVKNGDIEQLVSKYVDPAAQPAARMLLAGETGHLDEHDPGPKKNFYVAGISQATVDQWKTTTGEVIAPKDVGIVGRDPRLNAAKSMAFLNKFAMDNRAVYKKEFHREPTAADIATMHQQGTAGAMKLFHALRDNRQNEPASNFVELKNLTKNNIKPDATVAQAVRGIANYYTGKTLQKPNFDTSTAPGMVAAGNLDPWTRPVLHNPDGGYSTTSSISIGTDKGEVLIPTVVDGKRLSEADAIAYYKKTGENLGTFKTPEDADRYATSLHNAQASMYDEHGNPKQAQQLEGRQYGSTSDYMEDHLLEAVDNYRTEISDDPAFAGRDDLVERAVSDFENKYRRQIRDQNQQYLVDAHQMQSAIYNGHLVTESDLMASSPENAATWLRLQYENPAAAQAMRNWFTAAAGGKAKGYGRQFNDVLQRVLAPVGDKSMITDPLEINKLVTSGENGPLTNTGADALLQVYAARHTPQGEHDASVMRDYLREAHRLISPLTKPEEGDYSPEGEKKFADFAAETLRLVAKQRQAGEPLSDILKKGGAIDVELGRAITQEPELEKWQDKLVHDSRGEDEKRAHDYMHASSDPKYLLAGIASKTITPHQAAQAALWGARSRDDLTKIYNTRLPDGTWLASKADVQAARDHMDKYKRNYYGVPVK